MRDITYEEWKKEARERFGDDPSGWRFVCPSCGHVAAVKDWDVAGAPRRAVAFSCVGRYLPDAKAAADAAFRNEGGPCNYTGGGLLKLNPVRVRFDDGEEMRAFEFAEVAS